MKRELLLAILVLSVLTACMSENVQPAPVSDSAQQYSGGQIPVDDNVYLIVGEVVGDIGSLTQTSAQSTYKQYDTYATGSYWMTQSGKGFVRVKVSSCSPPADEARPEDVVILKTTDSKVIALLPGDRVTLKCRRQYEALAAVRERETFSASKMQTWEIDYCRMVTPVILAGETGK